MKKKHHKEEEIIKILKEADQLQDTAEICRKYNISQNTFYRWRSLYEGMEVSELKKLKTMEKENNELKRLVADLSLEVRILKDINSKKW